MEDPKSVQIALADFCEGATGTRTADAVAANRSVDKLRHAAAVLAMTDSGRAALTRLLDDNEVRVRCWAASYCLTWKSEAARSTLEEIMDAGEECSFDAKWTLIEHDSNR